MERTELMKRYEAETGESLEEAKERWKTFAFYSRYIAWLEAQLTWRSVSELPEEDQIVIATYLNSYGKRRRVRAVYIRQYEEESDYDYDSDYEYNEENDTYYLKEGWYELIDNWDDYSSVAIVEGVVDYWMPMPPASPCPMEGR
jgi:hypothetical protein